MTPTASPGEPAHQPDVWSARWFWPAFGAVVLVAVALVQHFGRRVFLWSDDYVFLHDARNLPIDLGRLRTPLFGHFSPVSQLGDSLLVANLADHGWLVWAGLLALGIAVVGSVAFLMVGLFGRTWPTLIGTAVAAPALSLLGPLNWWTAGLNMMPAFAGLALCFGAMVRLVRGGSRWWGLLAIGSFAVAVLALELGVTAVGYAFVWTVLFRSRVTDEPARALFRRTAWAWTALALIAVWSVLNYRLDYYEATPSPSVTLALRALFTSLVTIQLPMLLGIFDPDRPWFRGLGIALGVILTVALVVVTMVRSRRAWRGWAFALLGWLLPVLAVVLTRVGYVGVRAIEQPMYYYLPNLLFVVGALEAWAAPWAHAPERPSPEPGRAPRRAHALVAVPVAAVGLVVWTASAWPTISHTNYGMIPRRDAPERHYMANLLASAHALQAAGRTFSVIDRPVPGAIVNFQGHNRLSQLTAVHDPSIAFNAPDGPYYMPEAFAGTLTPARIEWLAEVVTTDESPPVVADGLAPTSSGCFVVERADASLRWDLGTPVAGDRLVVRTMARTDRDTPVRVSTTASPADASVVADVNPRTWSADRPGRLDSTTAPQIAAVTLDSWAVGTTVCIDSIQVGNAVSA